ncbi:BTAD domain-containing putative transcriptional regulator [Saccharothrix isguenensis]
MDLELSVLGPVEARVAGRVVSLGGGTPLIVLAGLLLRAGEVVTVDRLARWLWDDRDPDSVKGPLHNYVSRLRGAIGDRHIHTERNGYRAVVGAALDLTRFVELTASGEELLAAGEARQAATRFEQALALWRGPALANVDSDVLRRDELPALEERRFRARENWTSAMLALGDHAAVITPLRRWVAEQPLREHPHAQLMLALHRSGRTADALEVYRAAATALSDELGLDPGPALRRAHHAILVGDPDAHAAGPAPGPAAVSTPLVPRQLPAPTGRFVGRHEQLAVLRSLVPTGGLATIEGMGGAGKTALAALLEAVGVPESRLPRDLAGRSALWRSVTADRKLFVLLDDAPGSEYVRPLLPARGNLVVVTGRAGMAGLAARDGAVRLPLPRLATPDALDLLGAVIGAGRVESEPDAAGRLVRCCDRLPLAIRILGEQVNRYPDLPLAEVVSDLVAEDRFALLDTFDLRDGDATDLSAVFSYSYRALDPPVARLFRLTGFFVGPDDFAPEPIAAGLAECRADQVRAALDSLVAANLLARPGRGRYRFHDLVRTYAATLSARYDSEEERAAVGDRVLGWYLATTMHVCRLLWPNRRYDLVEPFAAGPGRTFADRESAAAWCDAEAANLVPLVHSAYCWARYAAAWQLAWLLQPYLIDRERIADWEEVTDLGLAAAGELGDHRAEKALLRDPAAADRVAGVTAVAGVVDESAGCRSCGFS